VLRRRVRERRNHAIAQRAPTDIERRQQVRIEGYFCPTHRGVNDGPFIGSLTGRSASVKIRMMFI